jgi:hypothetical protein
MIVLVTTAYYAWPAKSPTADVQGATRWAGAVDGLYFTVTVLSTVGFGDIHAVSSTARLLVTPQMLFGLIYIGTAVRLLTSTDMWERLTTTPRG